MEYYMTPDSLAILSIVVGIPGHFKNYCNTINISFEDVQCSLLDHAHFIWLKSDQ